MCEHLGTVVCGLSPLATLNLRDKHDFCIKLWPLRFGSMLRVSGTHSFFKQNLKNYFTYLCICTHVWVPAATREGVMCALLSLRAHVPGVTGM